MYESLFRVARTLDNSDEMIWSRLINSSLSISLPTPYFPVCGIHPGGMSVPCGTQLLDREPEVDGAGVT